MLATTGGRDKIGDFVATLTAFLSPLVLKIYRQVSLIAFDPRPEMKIRDSKGNEFTISKGLPPVIFELKGGISREDLVKAEEVVGDFAARGYRTLAAARTDEGGKWVMLGILPVLEKAIAPRQKKSHAAAWLVAALKATQREISKWAFPPRN